MKTTKRNIFAVASLLSASLFALSANSQESSEGNGIELTKEVEVSFFCELFPSACVATAGNGGGKEPPIK